MTSANTKRKQTAPTQATPQSAARWAFDNNLAYLTHSIALSRSALKKGIRSLKRGADGPLEQLRRKPTTQRDIELAARKIGESVNRFSKEVNALIDSNRWRTVTLVTLVEAYLQDMLADAAFLDASLIAKSGHSVSYEQLVAARSIDQLATELRVRWARSWVTGKGLPSDWLGALGKMGAHDFADDLGRQMDYMWSVRHVVVHQAGRPDRKFIDRYPHVKMDSEGKVPVSTHDFGVFVKTAGDFITAAEQYFLSRLPNLAVVCPLVA